VKLYEIAAAIDEALSRTDEDGELMPGVERELDSLDMLLTEKADNIAAYMRQCDAEATAYFDEIARLTELRVTAINKRDRLKEYLRATMEKLGVQNISTPRFKMSLCKNSTPSVTLTGELIPPEYQRVTVTLDAKKVIEQFKACQPIPACFTITHGTHLRVK